MTITVEHSFLTGVLSSGTCCVLTQFNLLGYQTWLVCGFFFLIITLLFDREWGKIYGKCLLLQHQVVVNLAQRKILGYGNLKCLGYANPTSRVVSGRADRGDVSHCELWESPTSRTNLRIKHANSATSWKLVPQEVWVTLVPDEVLQLFPFFFSACSD